MKANLSAVRFGVSLISLLGWTGSISLSAAFTDVSETAGLLIGPISGPELDPPAGIDPYITGSPICAADLNADGWTDLILCSNPGPLQVFLNQQDGTFAEVAEAMNLGGIYDISGIAAGDLDNDGDLDLVMVPRIGPRYFLYINDGSGTFSEQAIPRGADMTVVGEPHKGQSIALVDYDLDGYLDIHVMEWGIPASDQSESYAVLLKNRGREMPAYFINATRAAGLMQPYYGNSIDAFSSAWADFNDDGYPDLSLINDFGNSQFWWNQGDGTFREGRNSARVGTDGNGMGVAVMDFNRDGLLDFFVSSFDDLPGGTLVSANRLYENQGDGTFKNVAPFLGVEDSSWGWGTVFFDPDNDMDLDIVVTNGYPYGHRPGRTTPPHTIMDARTDVTRYFQNSGQRWSEAGASVDITDKGFSRSVIALDYDRDGDEDLLIGNLPDTAGTYQPWILYRNDFEAKHNWIRLRFQGVYSNRDGYGTRVRLTADGVTQTAVYAPTNAYVSQREPWLHFGIGSARAATTMEVRWPNGTTTVYQNIAANQEILIREPLAVGVSAPQFEQQPQGGSFAKDDPLTLHANATGTPTPTYQWYKDGIPLAGEIRPTLHLERLLPSDAGRYSLVASNAAGQVRSTEIQVDVFADLSRKSIARWWIEAALDAIRVDNPNPPVHARNLFHLSSAIWDSFWAFEPGMRERVEPAFVAERPAIPKNEAERLVAQRSAISYAAFRLLQHRFAESIGASKVLPYLDWLMGQLELPTDATGTGGDDPSAVGNRIADAVIQATLQDGANESLQYADATGYQSVNEPMIVGIPGTVMADPNRWQPLLLGVSITQNGILLPSGLQSFIGSNAPLTRGFALAKPTASTIAIDPGPPPLLGGISDAQLVDEVVEVIARTARLDPADGVWIDISPSAPSSGERYGYVGAGHELNPATGQPYPEQQVPYADYGRVLAEYWADGPDSETPPGHWNLIFNQVSDHPAMVHRIEGEGPILDRLQWDVRGYFVLNAALHDAALAAWTLKNQYDSSRPISLIRYMAGLGQRTDPSLPRYHAQGLPLVPGLIELTTLDSLAPGGRHAEIVQGRNAIESYADVIVLHTWRGNRANRPDQVGGVGWKQGVDWHPYQRNTFVSPAFPGYVSGHSTFSRAAAEVLQRFTGDPFFPGGLASRRFEKDAYLEFEKGPSVDFELQWATYLDAANEAGLSRLYGGIHIAADDQIGRQVGAIVARDAYLKAKAMIRE